MQSMANDIGVSSHTINEWMSLLEASFITFRLPPWFANIGKRPTRKIAEILGDRVKDMSLIYGGRDYQKRTDFEVIPYRNLGAWMYPD